MIQFTSAESGGNLALPYPLVKLICEQETALNQQGPLFEGKGKVGDFFN